MVRGGHTQGGSRNTPLALLQDTSIPTHTLLVVRVVNHLTDWDPSPSPHSPPLPSTSYSPSPPLPSPPPPLPSLATTPPPPLTLPPLPLPSPPLPPLSSPFLLSLYPSPFTSQSSLSSSENSSSFSVRANLKLLSPPTIKPGRLQEGEGEEGGPLRF